MELQGKTIAFLGDSITEGVGVSDRPNNRYDNVIKRTCGLRAVYNYGIGGTRLAHQQKPSENPRYDLCFCGRAFLLEPTADIVVVYGGINDYIHGDAPFGKKGDTTPETFCGAVYFLMNHLKAAYAGKPVVFMTPAHCHFKGVSDQQVSPRPMKKPDARTVVDYVDVILATGREMGIPVLDLYRTLGIDPNREEDRARLTVDGLHFNDAAHAIIADRLIAFLQAL